MPMLHRILVPIGAALLIGLGVIGDYDGPIGMANPLAPASLAFAIWAPLFVGAIAVSTHRATCLGPGARPLAAAYALAGCWVWVFPVLPLGACELVLVATAALGIAARERLPRAAPAWIRVSVGLFAGWISVALVVASVDLMMERGVLPVPIPGNPWWALGLIVGVAAVGLASVRRRPDEPGYPIAIAWGFGWIAVGQSDRRVLAVVALIAAVAVGGGVAWARRVARAV
jgi:hypothetical protein